MKPLREPTASPTSRPTPDVESSRVKGSTDDARAGPTPLVAFCCGARAARGSPFWRLERGPRGVVGLY